MNLAEKVREVPDWPQPGVSFKDVTPLLADPTSLSYAIEQLAAWGKEMRPDLVLGAEARGFILGAAIAREIGCGFIPARRPGKLPPETVVRPGHTDPTTIGDEWEQNPFIRIWRGLDPEGDDPCTALGEPATLVLWGDDYDGGHKAWVRWPDGADDIVPGSQVQRPNA